MKKIREIDCERFLKIHNGTIDKEFKSVRLVKGYSWSMSGSTYQWAYLDLKDGVVVSADYGYAKYKGIRLINCKECWENNLNLRKKDIFTGKDC